MHRFAAILVLAFLLAACGGAEPDRALALQNLTEGQGVPEGIAQCVVDELSDEQLSDFDNLDTEALVAEEDGELLAALGASCAEANLGEAVGLALDEIDCSTVDGPCAYGDDADLDVLYDACEGGDDAACGELFQTSPIGSVYEAFGSTCGTREGPGTCA